MKKVMFMLVAVFLIGLTANAQKDTVTYKDGWIYGRSAENTMGVYLGLDSTGVRKVVLTISEDSVKFNRGTYYVAGCQDRGKDNPMRFKDCYLFIITDKNDDSFYMYLEKVNNRNAVNKYHFVLRKDWRDDKKPLITEIITKTMDPVTLSIDPITKREDREKQAWFNKMYANKVMANK
jgi:hypothetical protein